MALDSSVMNVSIAGLFVLAVIALIALFFARRIPDRQPGSLEREAP